MRKAFLIAGCLSILIAANAGKLNMADFPLRVHIFGFNGAAHYYAGSLNSVDGERRANLYENGEPRGFDFSYNCADRLRMSPGFETYMARWKKPGKTLEILLPVFGKPDASETCDLKVLMKDTAYMRRNGLLGEEPASVFKDWMIKHKYDPEHGLNQPERLPGDQPQVAQPPNGAASPR
jgi:hypothetical protein